MRAAEGVRHIFSEGPSLSELKACLNPNTDLEKSKTATGPDESSHMA